MAQNVERLGLGQFKIWWDEQPDTVINMDFGVFRPLVRGIGQFCLIHWQAKPKGLRRWGVYDSGADQYFGFDWNKVEINFRGGMLPLQVNELVVESLPTAVIFLPGASVLALPNKPLVVR